MLFVVTRDPKLGRYPSPSFLNIVLMEFYSPRQPSAPPWLMNAARLGVPVTLFNRSVPDAHASSFCCDNIEGGPNGCKAFHEIWTSSSRLS
jgi:hypothetical protein